MNGFRVESRVVLVDLGRGNDRYTRESSNSSNSSNSSSSSMIVFSERRGINRREKSRYDASI